MFAVAVGGLRLRTGTDLPTGEARMAEQVKRRVTAARIAVAFAAAGVIAGAAATATGAPARDEIPNNAIGTQEIKNDSLLWKDFKDGEVYSKDQVAGTFLKIDDAAKKFLKIDDANVKFLKIDGTAANSAKLGGLSAGDFVQGDGSVFTGTAALVQGQVEQLVSLDKMFAVEIDNESGTPDLKLHRSPDGPPSISFAFDGGGGTLDAGTPTATIPFDGSADTEVVQILIGDAVGTLTISVVPKSGGGELQAFAQILIGL